MSASVIPFARRRAQLARYALWQLGDFGFNVAIISIILFSLFGYLAHMQIQINEEMMRRMHREMTDATRLVVFKDVFAAYCMIATIVALSGFVSQDRTNGYTRFLFAKPLSPLTYYSQSFLVRLFGYVAVGSLLIAVWSIRHPPALSVKLLLDMVLVFVAIGGLLLLFSVASKYDGLLLIIFLLVGEILRETWEKREGIKRAATYLFPPFNHVGELHGWAVGLTPGGAAAAVDFPAKWVIWMVGYGLAAGILGLYLLRKIPLTKT